MDARNLLLWFSLMERNRVVFVKMVMSVAGRVWSMGAMNVNFTYCLISPFSLAVLALRAEHRESWL